MDICRDISTIIKENLNDIIRLRNTGRMKSDSTFVSDGDLLSERLVMDYLNKTVPDCLIVSEESPNDGLDYSSKKYVITVDPIDGTENFVSGLKEWGVGVSVYCNMKHQQSMLLLPELDIRLITGDKLEKVTTSRICGLSSYMRPEDFEQLGRNFEYRIMGCCMYNMYNVIKGCYKKFYHLKGCYSWDILPGMNLALEHGLNVTIDGRPYKGEFLKPGIRYSFCVES